MFCDGKFVFSARKVQSSQNRDIITQPPFFLSFLSQEIKLLHSGTPFLAMSTSHPHTAHSFADCSSIILQIYLPHRYSFVQACQLESCSASHRFFRWAYLRQNCISPSCKASINWSIAKSSSMLEGAVG